MSCEARGNQAGQEDLICVDDITVIVSNVPCLDTDGDTICDTIDNCKYTPNHNEAHTDNDAVGDVCDNCKDVSNPNQLNSDIDLL